MFFSNIVLAAAAFAGFAAAQAQGPYTVDPGTVEYPLRQSWCRSQQSLCPQICGGQANPNTCDPNTLQWACTCTNGQSPNISDYVNTIPYYTCAQWRINCVANAPNDIATQSACLSVICGARTVGAPGAAVVVTTSVIRPTSAAASTAASSAATTAASSSPAPATSGSGIRSSVASAASSVASAASSLASAASSAAAAATSPAAAAGNMLEFGHSYGTGAVAVGLLALFGLAL